MSNSFAKHINVKQHVKTIDQRLKEVEVTLKNVMEVLQVLLEQMSTRFRPVNETLAVVVDQLGRPAIEQEIVARRVARAKQAVDVALAEGRYADAEEVGPKSWVIGHEEQTDGTVIDPGYAQVKVEDLQDEAQAKIVGLKAGGKALYGETYFAVERILNPVENKSDDPLSVPETTLEAAPPPEGIATAETSAQQ